MKGLFLFGRLILGGFFVYNGINHFKQREGMAQYAGAKNVPNPEVAVLASGAMLVAGGTSLILGLKPKVGMLPLLGFLGIVSPMIHDFWNEQDAQSKQQQMIHFSKNMALAGAVLALMSVEEWPLSVAGS
ncbi:MAG: DoxX family protein [Acidobacteriaceae bacterium]|nr:DoxX family protein [Acidobacteriaceae bacterium]